MKLGPNLTVSFGNPSKLHRNDLNQHVAPNWREKQAFADFFVWIFKIKLKKLLLRNTFS